MIKKLLKSQVISRFESESELFTGDTSKDNHSPGTIIHQEGPVNNRTHLTFNELLTSLCLFSIRF